MFHQIRILLYYIILLLSFQNQQYTNLAHLKLLSGPEKLSRLWETAPSQSDNVGCSFYTTPKWKPLKIKLNCGVMQQSIVIPTPPTSENSGGKWGIFLLLTWNFPSPGRGFLFYWSPTPVCGALGGGNRGVRHIEYRNEIRTPSGPSEFHVLLVASHGPDSRTKKQF